MIELRAPQHLNSATIQIKGSKSISNRLLILKQLYCQDLLLHNLSDSEDTRLLILALQKIQHGNEASIDIGHAGTDFRFLCAVLACTPGKWILTGSARIKERPIGPLVDVLRLLGADIRYLEREQYAPLYICGKALVGGSAEIEAGISSQFVSALLMVAPLFEKGLKLTLLGSVASAPYINMTAALMKNSGLEVSLSENTWHIKPFTIKPQLKEIAIESDWSSASYFYGICALSQQSTLQLKNFNSSSLQADAIVMTVFRELGVYSTLNHQLLTLSNFPVNKQVFEFNCESCPDIAQTLAVTCFALNIPCYLNGLKTLKFKETDRIAALKTELAKLNAEVLCGEDWLRMTPPAHIKSSHIPKINTYQDHRMAMSFALLALKYKCVRIEAPDVVSKSYPAFWSDLKSLGFSVHLLP